MASMTKKDFVAIQTAIKDCRDALLATQVSVINPRREDHIAAINRIVDPMARDISKVLSKQNPKFQTVAFLQGCGVVTP